VIKELEMPDYRNLPESDPRHHTSYVREQFEHLSEHLREDVEKVGDPQAKALFETSAEVLDGLSKAFQHYEERSEPAWKEQQR